VVAESEVDVFLVVLVVEEVAHKNGEENHADAVDVGILVVVGDFRLLSMAAQLLGSKLLGGACTEVDAAVAERTG